MKKALVHLLVCIAVVVMVVMGFWQLDRLDAKKKLNQEIEDRAIAPIVPVEEVVTHADPWSVGETLQFRRVTALGEYRDNDSVLIRNRSLNGLPGYWLLTPLVLEEEIAVIVNRGWIPVSAEGFSPEPTGEVLISGLLQKSMEASGLQKNDPSGEILRTLARVDLKRYQEQLDYMILPVYLQLEYQEPDDGIKTIPFILEKPSFDEGPHLNYAIQWFCFAAVFSIGYPIVLWRNEKKKGSNNRSSEIPIDYL